jgi:hypothetical protein
LLTGSLFSIKTENFTTPHQIIGFIAVGMLGLVFLFGITARVLRRHFGEKRTSSMHVAHGWGGRIVWVLLLIDGGL